MKKDVLDEGQFFFFFSFSAISLKDFFFVQRKKKLKSFNSYSKNVQNAKANVLIKLQKILTNDDNEIKKE